MQDFCNAFKLDFDDIRKSLKEMEDMSCDCDCDDGCDDDCCELSLVDTSAMTDAEKNILLFTVLGVMFVFLSVVFTINNPHGHS